MPTLFFCMLSPLLFPSQPPQQHIHVYVRTVNVPHAYKRDGPFASATDKCRLFSSLKEVRVLLCVCYSLPCLGGCFYVCLPACLSSPNSFLQSFSFFFSSSSHPSFPSPFLSSPLSSSLSTHSLLTHISHHHTTHHTTPQ